MGIPLTCSLLQLLKCILLAEAIIHTRMETTCLNVCSAIHCGQVGDYFIHSRKKKPINMNMCLLHNQLELTLLTDR